MVASGSAAWAGRGHPPRATSSSRQDAWADAAQREGEGHQKGDDDCANMVLLGGAESAPELFGAEKVGDILRRRMAH
jgi:hypothetical protein